MPHDSWTGKWFSKKLLEMEIPSVEGIDLLSDKRMLIRRKDAKHFQVATMDSMSISLEMLEDVLDDGVDFVLNRPRGAELSADAYESLETKKVAFGSFGDLLRAIEMDEPREYVEPESRFLLRGLRQHSHVLTVSRISRRRYRVNLHGGGIIIIVALNDYDLGIDAVREAVDRDVTFDIILRSNPNGRATSDAMELANSRGTPILSWKELLGFLRT